jgi:hypothetical protein
MTRYFSSSVMALIGIAIVVKAGITCLQKTIWLDVADRFRKEM